MNRTSIWLAGWLALLAAFGPAAGDEKPNPDDVYLDGLKLIGQIAGVVENLKNRADADAAKPSLERLVERWLENNAVMDSLKLSNEEKKKLDEKHKAEREKALARFAKAVLTVQQNDADAFKIIDPILSRMGKKKPQKENPPAPK